MKKLFLSAAIAVSVLSANASTDGHFMLAIFSPGEFPAPTSSIYGGRLSLIYGECHDLYGVDLGLAGYVRERMEGVQFNLWWSGVGPDATGVQFGLLNTVEGDACGLQCGFVNMSDRHYGCQWGFVNVTRRLYGCQLGLLNITTDRDWKFWPFVNIGW